MAGADTIQLLVLEHRDPARDMARFYVLSLEETLFGDTALVREWGRLGTTGRRRLDLFEKRPAAREALDAWLRRKVRKGYRQQSHRETCSDFPATPSARGLPGLLT